MFVHVCAYLCVQIDDRYFWISEEEAKRHWPLHYQKYYHTPELGWAIGLDVFHTLHCVVSAL